MEVYFDDFKVTQIKSPVISTDDYYPFGLIFNSYQRENSLINKFRYNGKELQEELGLVLYDYIARQYDPVIGKFTSIDPLAEKMRRHSPYNYAFDNPLRFIDPDGMGPRDVIIQGSSSFQKTAFADLQKLSGTPLTMLPGGKVVISSSAEGSGLKATLGTQGQPTRANYVTEANKPIGTSMIEKQINSDKVVTITETNGGNSTAPLNSTDANVTSTENGPGTGSTIEYNPNSTGSGIVNEDGNTGRPAEIGLGHELAHAEQNSDGTRDKSPAPKVTDPDSGKKGVLTKNEITVRGKDSQIRQENNVVERKQPK